MKLDKLVKLEKALEGKLDRLTRRKGSPEDPFEWIPSILDEIEQRVVPSGGRGRMFPYELIRVRVRVRPGSAEAARAVFGAGAFEERVRERLGEARCEVPAELRVRVRIVESGPVEEGESPYAVEFRRPTTSKERKDPAAQPAETGVPAVRIVVVEGHARRRIHPLKLERINLGRMESVEGRGPQGVRRNHVAFVDTDDPVNTTVSRAHAHIEHFEAHGFRLFDDGSVHGTRIVRDGRSIPVARGATRGVKLRHGDEIQLGMARLVFLVE